MDLCDLNKFNIIQKLVLSFFFALGMFKKILIFFEKLVYLVYLVFLHTFPKMYANFSELRIEFGNKLGTKKDISLTGNYL